MIFAISGVVWLYLGSLTCTQLSLLVPRILPRFTGNLPRFASFFCGLKFSRLSTLHTEQRSNYQMSSQQHKKADDTLQRNIQVQDAMREMLICPISRQIMTDPVTTPFGQTYDLSSLVKAWNGKNDLLVTDPLTRQKHSRMLTPSWERRKIIAAILPQHTMAKRQAGSLIFVFAPFDDGSVELQQVEGAWVRTDGKAIPTWLQKRLAGNRAAALSTSSGSGIRQDPVSAGSPSPAYGSGISAVGSVASVGGSGRAGAGRGVLPSIELPSNFDAVAGSVGGRGAGRGAAPNLGNATGPGPVGGGGAGRGAAPHSTKAMGVELAGGRAAGRGAAPNFVSAGVAGPRSNALFETLAQVAVEEAEVLQAEERELDAMLQQQQIKKPSPALISAGFCGILSCMSSNTSLLS